MSGPDVRAGSAPAGAAPDVFAPLNPVVQRRGQLVQSLVERGPLAVVLVFAGVAGLGERTHVAYLALAAAQVLAGAWQLAMFAVELRETAHIERARRAGVPAARPAHARIAWPDVAAGLLLGVEVWQLWSTTGRVKRPQAVLAAVTEAIGLARGRLRARRGLTVSADGLTLRRRPWGGTTIAWSDAHQVELTRDRLVVRARDGRAIRLLASRYDGGHEALQAVRDALPIVAPAFAPVVAPESVPGARALSAPRPVSPP